MGPTIFVHLLALFVAGVGLNVEAFWWMTLLAVGLVSLTVAVDVVRSNAP